MKEDSNISVETDSIYRKLQRHLNTLPIGYPKTESGVELRLLKYVFTPKEAEIAIKLRFIPDPIEAIYRRVKKKVKSIEELEAILFKMYEKGGIRIKRTMEGNKQVNLYQNAFLAVGMFEYQVKRLTKEYFEDFLQYMDEGYRDELASTKINQLRTIPVEKSIDIDHNVANYDQLENLLENASRISIMPCVCRKGQDLIGEPCQQTDMRETCFVLNDSVDHVLELGWGREITKDEAREIFKKVQEDGLIIQPGNVLDPSYICCCCGCCCCVTTNLKKLERPWEMITTNYYAEVDSDLCIGCETCVQRCQMEAIIMNDSIAEINKKLCIGCGNCISTCPESAIILKKKERELSPPKNNTELYLKIMDKKAKLRRREKGIK
ncbi:MAG: 4Fe-4S dicluster domain-containing protein [Promethearchaeota archaeon]|nr:MAG: 4Fe-4S dicluster domain-containing protein [Candidatus Lokiarchaeota archaeon]